MLKKKKKKTKKQSYFEEKVARAWKWLHRKAIEYCKGFSISLSPDASGDDKLHLRIILFEIPVEFVPQELDLD